MTTFTTTMNRYARQKFCWTALTFNFKEKLFIAYKYFIFKYTVLVNPYFYYFYLIESDNSESMVLTETIK